MKYSRRSFVKAGLALGGGTSLSNRFGWPGTLTEESGVLHEGLAIEPRPNLQEATLAQLVDGRYWLLFGESRRGPSAHYKESGVLVGKLSSDQGRTWQETKPLRATDGSVIPIGRLTAHHSLLKLPSGALGLIYGGPYARTGRDGTVLFRRSDDGGQTWSPPVMVDAYFSVCRNSSARVLNRGRILVPVMAWISPDPGGISEWPQNHLTYSWVYYSDDEGETWQRSLSELYVSLNGGQQGCHHFEEAVVEELKDGRILMVGRTELGRQYQTISEDGSISWSSPKPVELSSAYAPSTLIRLPATGHLLLIWNQVSTEEILSGLQRHRLSTAISTDEGTSWKHFRNLESLDDRTQIEPLSGSPKVYRMDDYAYRQPQDSRRYPHAPGCLRVCYPTAVCSGNEVAIAYDYGFGVSETAPPYSATKVKIVSLNWLYGKRGKQEADS